MSTENQWKTGVELVAEERARQISEEGYSREHDRLHDRGELACAAACYASPVPIDDAATMQDLWPWPGSEDKRRRHGRIRALTIAGALICAEIDRLQAVAAASSQAVIVHFEDKGQDCLRWLIRGGEVVDSSAQTSTWVGTRVVSGPPEVGKHLAVRLRLASGRSGTAMYRYKVVKVEPTDLSNLTPLAGPSS